MCIVIPDKLTDLATFWKNTNFVKTHFAIQYLLLQINCYFFESTKVMHKCREKERKREDHDSLGIRENPRLIMWAEQNLACYILFSIFVIVTPSRYNFG